MKNVKNITQEYCCGKENMIGNRFKPKTINPLNILNPKLKTF